MKKNNHANRWSLCIFKGWAGVGTHFFLETWVDMFLWSWSSERSSGKEGQWWCCCLPMRALRPTVRDEKLIAPHFLCSLTHSLFEGHPISRWPHRCGKENNTADHQLLAGAVIGGLHSLIQYSARIKIKKYFFSSPFYKSVCWGLEKSSTSSKVLWW